MNLDGLMTRTTVEFSTELEGDSASVDDKPMTGPGLERISHHLDHIRKMAGINYHTRVQSENNFSERRGHRIVGVGVLRALSLAATAAFALSSPNGS